MESNVRLQYVQFTENYKTNSFLHNYRFSIRLFEIYHNRIFNKLVGNSQHIGIDTLINHCKA